MGRSHFESLLIDALMLRVRFLSRELRRERRRARPGKLHLSREPREVRTIETSFGRVFDAAGVERLCEENERLKALCHRLASSFRHASEGVPFPIGVFNDVYDALEAFEKEMAR